MEEYIAQLIQDLENAAQNPPTKPWIEPPPHLAGDEVLSELALVPYKPIEAWSGIGMEVFPEMWELSADQCRQVNRAIFKLFDALHLKLVDLPGNIPPEMLYEVFATNWDQPVQYLPSSGMDLELCTGAPHDCPYGNYCENCLPEDEALLPEKLLRLVPDIAESIDAGLVVFLNPDTLETEEIPQSMLEDTFGLNDVSDFKDKDEMRAHEKWEKCWVFEPLPSFEAYHLMENFAIQLFDEEFRDELLDVLNRSKPFVRFKAALEGTEQRQAWFRFKQYQLELQVKRWMNNLIKLPEDFEMPTYNGIYDDDGSKIEPDSIPVPSLCTICRHHQSADQLENTLCLLNRNAQRDEDEFECGRFEKS